MSESPSHSSGRIRRYYEQNTRLFFALGSSPRAYSIHRSIWMDGVRTRDEALNTSNRLLLAQVESLPAAGALHLADLGCGIGGTLFYLLEHLQKPASGIGLTISPTQARLARRRARQLTLDEACLFLEADFLAPPLAGAFDLAYSIEAFVHAADPQLFFAGATRLLKPGSRLVLVDDFQIEEPVAAQSTRTHESSRRRWLDAYRWGWHVPNLITPAQGIALAQAYGLRLVQEVDLTPYLRLRTLPVWLASLLLHVGERLPVRHPILPSMLGSIALQQCLKMGWISYRLISFDKHA